MQSKHFSIGEALRVGWDLTKRHLRLLVGVVLAYGAVEVIPSLLSARTAETAPFLDFAVSVTFTVLSMIMQLGMLAIALRLLDDEPTTLSDLFAASHVFLKYLVASILYALIVAGGLLLLIVPGIIWGIMFQFYALVLVDRECGPIAALRESARMTKGARWNLLVLGIVLGLVNVLGALALLVGLFVTIPLTTIATAYVYRKLRAQTAAEAAPSEAPPSPPVEAETAGTAAV